MIRRQINELTRDLLLWLSDKDENLLEPPETPAKAEAEDAPAIASAPTEAGASVAFASAEVGKAPVIAKAPAEDAPAIAASEAPGALCPPCQNGRKERLEALKKQVLSCKLCPLCRQRLKPVFGDGNFEAKLMFIGEGPGFQEDRKGLPFVGRSGELLSKIIRTVLNLSRKDVYITNIVKCHPMKNPEMPHAHLNDRPPSAEEIAACSSYLKSQIEIIMPLCIITLGAVAAKFILGSDKNISSLRGKAYDYKINGCNIKVVPTYHPAALLRNPKLKVQTWHDMKLVNAIYNLNAKLII